MTSVCSAAEGGASCRPVDADPDAAGRIRVHELTTAGDLDDARDEWAALWGRCATATPFQSPDWIIPWWHHLGRGRLCALALRQQGRLVGVAPFFIHRPYGLPVRRLAFLGTGVTDYMDLLLEPQAAVAGASRALEYLADLRELWDYADLQQIPEKSHLPAAPLPEETHSELGPQEVCPLLALPGSVAAFRSSLSRKLREDLRYCRRRLDRAGGFSIERAQEKDVPDFLNALFSLHQARWNRRGLPGAFASAAVRRFHRQAAPALFRADRLRLYVLIRDCEAVAALYCLRGGGRVYHYAAGFDQRVRGYGPGTLLLAHAMEKAIEEGDREWDFLRGGERYKYAWGARDRSNQRLVVYGSGSRATAAAWIVAAETKAESRLKRLAAVMARLR